MAEKPILFSTPMVEALLDGRKSQTRRVIKDTGFYAIDERWHGDETAARERKNLAAALSYAPGNLLWVREAWHPVIEGHPVALYRADNEIIYHDTGQQDRNAIYEQPKRWRSPIHMPRWASRLTLEVTGVRIERLQEISEEDANAEGIEIIRTSRDGMSPMYRNYGCEQIPDRSARYSFQTLWGSINKKPGRRWQDSPWVAVIEFRTIKQNIDAYLAGKEAA